MNPSITIGLASVGKFAWRRVPLWIVAQLLGAFAAASVVFGIYYCKFSVGLCFCTGLAKNSLVLIS